MLSQWLWFGVGIKRYTTRDHLPLSTTSLWFGVGIKRYITICKKMKLKMGCGLVQESKDIQLGKIRRLVNIVVVWCRNQKIYNNTNMSKVQNRLWFDVGIKIYIIYTRMHRGWRSFRIFQNIGKKESCSPRTSIFSKEERKR